VEKESVNNSLEERELKPEVFGREVTGRWLDRGA
jgi:hypothetical protein